MVKIIKRLLIKDYITMFIPEKYIKKLRKDFKNLLSNMTDSKIKMQMIAAGGRQMLVEWSVNVLLNHLKMAAGLLLLQKY